MRNICVCIYLVFSNGCCHTYMSKTMTAITSNHKTAFKQSFAGCSMSISPAFIACGWHWAIIRKLRIGQVVTRVNPGNTFKRARMVRVACVGGRVAGRIAVNLKNNIGCPYSYVMNTYITVYIPQKHTTTYMIRIHRLRYTYCTDNSKKKSTTCMIIFSLTSTDIMKK